jgi:hypothetical protein
LCICFTMNDVDFKTGAACGAGPWFTRPAAHSTPCVVRWVLAESVSFRPQLYTALVRILLRYFEWWRKYKQKGNSVKYTHTHTTGALARFCVPTGMYTDTTHVRVCIGSTRR